MDAEMNEAAKLIQKGMEDNSKESPQLSIDPDTQKMAVVGDPNQIQPTNGDYKLTYIYSPDELTEEDKSNMKYREETDEYEVTVSYYGKRVKPLYRQKIDLLLADIFEEMGLLDSTGYNPSNVNNTMTSNALLNNIDKVAEIAKAICDIPKEQVEHLDAMELASFLAQVLANEPNILKESVAFLTQRLQQQRKNAQPTEQKKQNIPQN